MSGRSMAEPKVPASRDVGNGRRVCDPERVGSTRSDREGLARPDVRTCRGSFSSSIFCILPRLTLLCEVSEDENEDEGRGRLVCDSQRGDEFRCDRRGFTCL